MVLQWETSTAQAFARSLCRLAASAVAAALPCSFGAWFIINGGYNCKVRAWERESAGERVAGLEGETENSGGSNNGKWKEETRARALSHTLTHAYMCTADILHGFHFAISPFPVSLTFIHTFANTCKHPGRWLANEITVLSTARRSFIQWVRTSDTKGKD